MQQCQAVYQGDRRVRQQLLHPVEPLEEECEECGGAPVVVERAERLDDGACLGFVQHLGLLERPN